MRTFQRLMRAYENARVLEFDQNSKYVFLSDCHRGNGNFADEFSKNRNTFIRALNYYYENGFTYVEVGDGDELWEANHMSVIQEAHTDAIAAMKRFYDDGRMIMIYGNHNIYMRNEKYVRTHYDRYFNEFTERYVDIFPGLVAEEAVILKHKRTEQEIFVVHGHQGDAANDQFWFFTMLSLKYFWRYLHSFGIKSPASPVKNMFKRHKVERNYIKWIAGNRKMLICGHTHRFKYPRSNEMPYFNTGCCVYPTTITAIELERDLVSLVRWKVLVNDAGLLQIQRMVLMGPQPISKFDLRGTSEPHISVLVNESVHEINKSHKAGESAGQAVDDEALKKDA